MDPVDFIEDGKHRFPAIQDALQHIAVLIREAPGFCGDLGMEQYL